MASKKHKTNKQTKEKTVCGSDQQAQGVGLCLLDILVQGRSRDDSTFRELQDGFSGTGSCTNELTAVLTNQVPA